MRKLFRYQPINEKSLLCLESKQNWFAKPASFNDPFEFKLKRPSAKHISGLKEHRNLNPDLGHINDLNFASLVQEYFQKQIENFGVVCYSETNDNILMWSHYSNNHFGMCLGFEFDDTNEVGLYQVNYSLEYPDLDFDKIWHKDGMMKILWTKSKEWAYEKEWRQIIIEGNKLKAYQGRLVEVIFGCRTSEKDKTKVKEILKNDEVRFLDAILDSTKYKVKV